MAPIRARARFACVRVKVLMCLRPLFMYPLGKTMNGKNHMISCSSAYEKLGRMFNPSFIVPIPCGKCEGCLWDRRTDWQKRLLLESKCHKDVSFITLTYRDSELPSKPSKYHLQTFLKRLRNASRDFDIPPFSLRYFLVSEYGDKTGRLHYHGLLFGVNLLTPEWQPKHVGFKDGYPIFTSQVLSSIWSHGFVTVDRSSDRSISYISNYILDSTSDSIRLSSCGLGRGFFLDSSFKPSGLNSFGLDRFRNSFFLSGSFGSFKKYHFPRSFFRYLEKYNPVLFVELSQFRRKVAAEMSRGSPSDYREHLNLLRKDIKENKTL